MGLGLGLITNRFEGNNHADVLTREESNMAVVLNSKSISL